MYLNHIKVLQLYDQAHRAYHCVFHPLEMLEMHSTGETRGLKIIDYKRPFMGMYHEDFIEAILAHDCVYEVGKSKGWNERESLRVWGELTGRTDRLRAGIVEPLILATITHNPEDVDVPEDWRPLIAHMIDLDMAPLGADPEEYDRNSANLKSEFLSGGLDPDAYEAGRRGFLEHTLKTPAIFHTQQFIDAFERKARDNIRRALEPGYGL